VRGRNRGGDGEAEGREVERKVNKRRLRSWRKKGT
jgi:hypothetical protein